MKLIYRRTIYLTFITAFIILVPIITMYASGYGYNFKKNTFEKTGILYLDSQPKDALIHVNNKYENKTPNRFTRLMPDNYQVKITKDGYYTWEKELEVKSGLTTFAKNIILFKQNLPINIIEGEINILRVSPNKEKIIYSVIKENSEELRLLNLNNQSDFLIQKLNQKNYNELEFVSWSPNQNKIMIRQGVGGFDKYLIIDIDTLKIKELFNITRLNFGKVDWDRTDENYLYGLRSSVLYQIDLINDSIKALLSANIKDFQVRNKTIYYISQVADESFLNKSTIEEQKTSSPEKIKLPSPSQYTIGPSTQDYLALLDKKNNDLFVISVKSFDDSEVVQDIVLQDKAKEIFWSADFKNLLYFNDSEISTFNIENRQKNLINRYSTSINQVSWYNNHHYIIYQTENSIYSIETTGQNFKNDIELTSLPIIDYFLIDSAQKNIYFKGETGQQRGIYKLEIQ